ncbi:MAG: hypothetical protein HC871_01195, partial [Rhizobiales bacterium]|nr:hypothetical protein [Hyphomicrobiales bacterium]
MIAIAGQWQAAAAAATALVPKLAAGAMVEAQILGQNRDGIEVRIGTDRFQLDVPLRFAAARTLTLRAAGTASGHKVTVVEQDGAPLPKAISAHLTIKLQSSPPGASTILQKSEIRVLAQPLTPDGRVLGPSVALRLQVSGIDNPSATTAAPPAPDGEHTPSESADAGLRPPASALRTTAPGASSTILDRTLEPQSLGHTQSGEGPALPAPGGRALGS